ncbi:hypothetical protein GY45DRAFT_1432941 [Cubamyces sp. BRFM 1775]|nr:hypothetical protein GY45DRAFT_1432941 [Cubamyces sp. BRFM 1775]
MESCPPEILDHIFAYACTDDGHTGRALSAVSHTIRETSRRRALQSIALYGYDQIEGFLELLDQRAPSDNQVSHLFLTDHKPTTVFDDPINAAQLWVRERIPKEQYPRMRISRRDPSMSITRLLTTVGSHLSTLTFLLFEAYDDCNILATTLHTLCRLDELTMHCSTLQSTPGAAMPSCPSLRRLHIVSDCPQNLEPWDRETPLEKISQIAPPLTHLRVSRLRPYHLSTREYMRIAIKKLLGIERDSALKRYQGERGALVILPPDLSCIIMQTSSVTWSEASNLSSRQLEDCFRHFAKLDTRKRVSVELWPDWTCERAAYLEVQLYMRLKDSWEKRIHGEEGMWEVVHNPPQVSIGPHTWPFRTPSLSTAEST